MTTTKEHDAQIAEMTFAEVYPHYVTKVEKKGRTKEELHEVINWLTGFNEKDLQKMVDKKVTFKELFTKAKINPNAKQITGSICGYRIEEIEDEFDVYKQSRRMEKLIDELAKGRKMEKILREEKK